MADNDKDRDQQGAATGTARTNMDDIPASQKDLSSDEAKKVQGGRKPAEPPDTAEDQL